MERLLRVFSRQRPSVDMGQGHSGAVDESQIWRDGSKRQSVRSLPGGKAKSKKARKSIGATVGDTGDVYQGVDDWRKASAPYHVLTAPRSTRGPPSLDGALSHRPYEQSARDFDRRRPSRNYHGGSPSGACSNIIEYRYEGENKNRNSIRQPYHRRHREQQEYGQSDNESIRQKLAAEKKALKTSSTSEYGSGDPSPTTSQQPSRVLQSSRSDYGTGSDLSRHHHPTKSPIIDVDGFKKPHRVHHMMSDHRAPPRPPKSSYYALSSSKERQRAGSPASSVGDHRFHATFDNDQAFIRSERLSTIPLSSTAGDSPGSSIGGSPRKSPGSSECDKLTIMSLRAELEREQKRRRKLERMIPKLEMPQMQQRALEKFRASEEQNQLLISENKELLTERDALKKQIKMLERQLEHGQTVAIEAKDNAAALEKERNELQFKLEKCEYDKSLLEKQLMRLNGQTKPSEIGSGHSTLRSIANGMSLVHRYRQTDLSGSKGSSDSVASADRTLENVPHNSPLLSGAGEALCSRPPSAYYENSMSSTCSIPPLISSLRTPVNNRFAPPPQPMHRTCGQQPFYASHAFKHNQLFRPLDVQVANVAAPLVPRQPFALSTSSEDGVDEQRIFRQEQREEDENIHPLISSADHSMLLERGRACHSGSSISTVGKSLQTSLLKDDDGTRTSTPNKLIASSTGSVTPIAPQSARGSYRTDVVIAMVGHRLQYADGAGGVFEATADKPHTMLESSPVSMDDGYSTLTHGPNHATEPSTSSCAMVESTDGLEWDQYLGQTNSGRRTPFASDSKVAAALTADSSKAVSSVDVGCDVWDSKPIWKPRHSPLSRFSSETNLLALNGASPNFCRKRSNSETDSKSILPPPDIDFIKPSVKSREALFDPADLGMAALTSSDSLAFDQYSSELQQQMTDFKQVFYSLCAKTPSGSGPEPISDENASSSGAEAAARGKDLQLSTDEDSSGDCVVTEADKSRILDELARSASSSVSSEESNDGDGSTVELWSRQLRKKRAPKDARVRYSPPRASILGRDIFKRFGDRERRAIASFDFLKDMPTDLSGISSSPASPDDQRVRMRSNNNRSRKRTTGMHAKRASRSLTDLPQQTIDAREKLYENVRELKRRGSLRRLSSSSSIPSVAAGDLSDDGSSLPLSDFAGATDVSISNSSSSSISLQY